VSSIEELLGRKSRLMALGKSKLMRIFRPKKDEVEGGWRETA
jgi:hypothetical protein